ncbi:MBL fold metallo-hydrolase [Aequorivita echinoideorum]|uniref:MBL fold metallo-hydrolase n=1 Tax=Aequorivita echinoideorum TaxID=1549647 RepID=A0ABS5S7L8_9FLAO|nr:rhodanese-like domain-containing protein [Aequorivita echinoideorum]MBT0609193.1 MBL fold metallo-hydrolase [Aequorivita echinoideorum]
MTIKQFEYKPLAHFSYAIISDGQMALVDPQRDPQQYYSYAEENNAKIVAVFETHPHADFVSSHLQIHKECGATLYASKKMGAGYAHKSFDDGSEITIGKATFKAINTPGHSPDSITIVASENNETALFNGDTLFVGDVGRPDLRENVGHMTAKREELAKAMYHSIQNKFNDLPDNALVFPAHGAGSLCGKGMSADATSSTLGNERMGNWAFKKQTEAEFVSHLLDSQPFIPHYFGYNVDINKEGAEILQKSISTIPVKLNVSEVEKDAVIIDVRAAADFKKSHLPGSFNIMAISDNAQFETWLGSIVRPEEDYYLVVNSSEEIQKILNRVAKIGYEKNLKAVMTLAKTEMESSAELPLEDFRNNTEKYTIIDIRNDGEVADGKFFESALAIPLHRLRESISEIPQDKPIIVHCAAGFRSAAGSSIIDKSIDKVPVYDLGENIKDFK